jgi:hypothetical protein
MKKVLLLATFSSLLLSAQVQENWTIALNASKNINETYDFLEKNIPDPKKKLFVTKSKNYYVTTYGSFKTYKEANEFFKTLPKSAMVDKPYILKSKNNLKYPKKIENLVKVIEPKSLAKIKPQVAKQELEKKQITKKVVQPTAKANESKKNAQQEQKQAKLQEAHLAFKNKDYTKSYNLFYDLFLEDLENLDINFFLGRSAFELKKYDEAIVAYERILLHKPNTVRVQLEIARCYFMQRNYKESQKLFTKIKQGKHPKAVIDNIDRYLKVIDERIVKHSLKGVFIIGAGYDSNLNSKAESNTFYMPFFNLTLDNTTKDVSAYSHQEILLLNHSYDYKDNINIKNDFLIFNKNVIDYSEKNVLLFSYNPSIEHTYNDKLTMLYGVFADRLYFGSPLLMDTYGLLPKLTYKYSKDLIVNSFFKYQLKRNKQSANKNKDALYQQLNIAINKTVSPQLTTVSSIVLEKERKDSGTLTTVDYDAYTLGFGVNYKYSKKMLFTPKITYKEKTFTDKDPFYLVKQKNKEYNYNLTGTYIFSKKWIAQGILTYTDIKSNIPSSQYKKHTIGVNFIKPF